jgi:hypothetical protein
LNGIEIADKYWARLRAMLSYMAAYLRPDGRAPLIGDTDSGQVLPIVRRAADDHGYLLATGAAIFHEPRFEIPSEEVPEELLWILGEQGVSDYRSLPDGSMPESQSFSAAGIYLLRQDDLYLLFNASDAGVNGRGSHGHNDALSVGISAGGVPFIVDPGTHLYTADLHERHLFRSTAYHSTLQVDGHEQNTTEQSMPFIIGNEARPRVLKWESNPETDLVVAEHHGYQRLAQPVLHRRSVRFDKRRRFWLIEDELTGEGTHEFSFRFQFAPGLEAEVRPDAIVSAWDKINGASLLVVPLTDQRVPELEPGFVSTDYGAKQPSVVARWSERGTVPLLRRWAIIPMRASEDSASAAELIVTLRTLIVSEPGAVATGS